MSLYGIDERRQGERDEPSRGRIDMGKGVAINKPNASRERVDTQHRRACGEY